MKTLPNEKVSTTLRSSTQTGDGITKREHFASMIMQGLMGHCNDNQAAGIAVKLADMLIEELNKEQHE